MKDEAQRKRTPLGWEEMETNDENKNGGQQQKRQQIKENIESGKKKEKVEYGCRGFRLIFGVCT